MTRRLTCFGLMLYIILLLTQPCQDVFAAAPSGGEGFTNVVALNPTRGSDTPCEVETCSPFCICSCCSLSVGYHDVARVSVPQTLDPVPLKPAPTYEEPHTNSYHDTVWQPPKN